MLDFTNENIASTGGIPRLRSSILMVKIRQTLIRTWLEMERFRRVMSWEFDVMLSR